MLQQHNPLRYLLTKPSQRSLKVKAYIQCLQGVLVLCSKTQEKMLLTAITKCLKWKRRLSISPSWKLLLYTAAKQTTTQGRSHCNCLLLWSLDFWLKGSCLGFCARSFLISSQYLEVFSSTLNLPGARLLSRLLAKRHLLKYSSVEIVPWVFFPICPVLCH